MPKDDGHPKSGIVWLKTAACSGMCHQAKVSHDEYVAAIEYMIDKPEAQRHVLLQNLRKNIKAIGT